jgi:hypothetical protein
MLSLFLLTSTNCARKPGNNYTACILPGFSATEQSEVIGMLHAWERAVPVHFQIVIGGEELRQECSDQCFTVEPSTTAQLAQESGSDVIGWTHYSSDCDCGYVQLDTQFGTTPFWDQVRRTMIAHEIGHAMGLVHVPAGHLMYPGYGPDQPYAITCGDVRQWAELRGGTYTCQGDTSLGSE